MDFCVNLILLFFGFRLNSCSHLPKRKYYFVDLKLNWADAQRYCREKYSDLLTIESMDDINKLKAAALASSWSWIGLRDDPKSWRGVMGHDTNSWRWSATGQTSTNGYHNWRAGEPNSASANENCGVMYPNGTWNDGNCKIQMSFVCYTVTNHIEKTYVFILDSKNWTSAQAYCREHHTDLAMIENTAENNEVHSTRPDHNFVWIGLYRVPWTWSDKTQSSFRSWEGGQPNNHGYNQFCVAANSKQEWNDAGCHLKYNFICHQVTKLKTVMRMKIQTNADITDPAANAQILQQLRAVLTSQGWTDFNLQWHIQPRKQETKQNLTEPPCISDVTNPATDVQILQQLAAVLTSQEWTDFKLQWIQRRKQEKKEKLTQP